jgi:hypothetical protein
VGPTVVMIFGKGGTEFFLDLGLAPVGVAVAPPPPVVWVRPEVRVSGVGRGGVEITLVPIAVRSWRQGGHDIELRRLLTVGTMGSSTVKPTIERASRQQLPGRSANRCLTLRLLQTGVTDRSGHVSKPWSYEGYVRYVWDN